MKQRYFVDTNIFVRFLLNDHKILSQKAKFYFSLADNNQAILVSNILVIAEVFWVLKSFYKYPTGEINALLVKILSHKNIQVDKKPLIFSILKLCQEKNVDFVDAFCYLTATEQKIELVTFDKKLAKLKGQDGFKR